MCPQGQLFIIPILVTSGLHKDIKTFPYTSTSTHYLSTSHNTQKTWQDFYNSSFVPAD